MVLAYSCVVWLQAGILAKGWWVQLLLFGLSCYLMVELNNSNVLLRVRSRMIAATFIVLSTMLVTFFGQWKGGVCALSFIAALNVFFRSYQDREAVGHTYFAFCLIALASMFLVHMLLLVPILWLLMHTHLQSFSWSAWRASLLGLLTPYWLVVPWFVWQHDIGTFTRHFVPLAQIIATPVASQLDVMQMANVAFIVVLLLVSAIHFWTNRMDDKIRIRMLYGFLIVMSFFCIALVALLPQHYDPLLRILVVCASPVIAHFLTVSSSRFTNILFLVVVALCVVLTVINLYGPPTHITVWNYL